MIPAEEWIEYQENYKKYGIDLQPETDRKQKKRPAPQKVKVTAKDRAVIMAATVIIGVFLVGIIVLNAFAAAIKFDTSNIKTANEELQGEIETLSIMIQSEESIDSVERKAVKELGMLEPVEDRCIYIGNRNR